VLIAIDPGLRGCGVAYFDAADGKLLSAHYAKNPATSRSSLAERTLAMAKAVLLGRKAEPWTWLDTLVLELPQIYRFKGKGDPNESLVPLILIDGAIQALFGAPARMYLPHEWKGSVDPDVCIYRVQARLTPQEKRTVCVFPDSLAHNVWDAVGIGLFHLGRFNRKRVYAAS
jgi:hypothetical protein